MAPRIMMVYGTRPEAVKMAPLIRELGTSRLFTPVVTVTAQHRFMLDQVNELFGIRPDFDLDIYAPGQTLAQITNMVLAGVSDLLATHRQDAVIVQGDTTTALAAALAAFYQKIPVVHLEAGLRTGNPYSPYPEEINRQLITRLAALHLAPTPSAKANLLAENMDPARVVVTGNTVIDALLWAAACSGVAYYDPTLAQLDATSTPVLLVTAHRRESWGNPLRELGRALMRVAIAYPGLQIVFPTHPNPIIRAAIEPVALRIPNLVITEPLPYAAFVRLMNRAMLILTDSGGIQEEASSLGKPVLVLRDTTERTDALSAGGAALVGITEDTITHGVLRVLSDPAAYTAMSTARNRFGDGQAARRAVAALACHFGFGPPVDEFCPQPIACTISQA